MKKELSQFFTKEFFWLEYPQIKEFFLGRKNTYIDPYCGEKDLLKGINEIYPVEKLIGYDIDESLNPDLVNNSLENIPFRDGTLITNPPYLYKPLAIRNKRVGKEFERYGQDDLYKVAVKQCMKTFEKGLMIIPDSFLYTNLIDDIDTITIIEGKKMFFNTVCPVCIITWGKQKRGYIYIGNKKINKTILDFKNIDILFKTKTDIKINDGGDSYIGALCIDSGSKNKKAKFLSIEEIDTLYPGKKLTTNTRSIIKINTKNGNLIIKDNIEIITNECNKELENLRIERDDLILSPFKNDGNDGKRRRRIPFWLIKWIINKVLITFHK